MNKLIAFRSVMLMTMTAVALPPFVGLAADEAPPLLEKTAAADARGLVWIDGSKLPLEGRGFHEGIRPYSRLPDDAMGKPDLAKIRSTMHCPAGLCFRFKTDSNVLCIRWKLDAEPPYGFWNATAVLNAGIDVYAWLSGAGWRFWKSGRPSARTNEVTLAWVPNRPCMIYLPVSRKLDKFELGVRAGSKVEPLGPHASGVNKPVVVYGASMVHGYSSSRPGMIWTSVLSRMLDAPVVNQGYNGQARMVPSIGDYLASIDASAYCFLMCGGNFDIAGMRQHTRPFLERIHRARPDVPILLGEYYYVVGPGLCNFENEKRDFTRLLVAELKAEDPELWRNLHLVERKDLFCEDGDGTIDDAHFNDRGAYRCAEAFAKALEAAWRN